MSRVTKYKIGYVIALAALAGCIFAVLRVVEPGPWIVAMAALVLLLPGRIQGLLFRDLFRGRSCLDRNDAQSAFVHFNSFLSTIKSQPWRRHALWLSWSVYTPDVEAMTWNNIGSAKFGLGDLPAAEEAWSHALSLDPLYPLPHANLALAAATRGEEAVAKRHLDEARALGYSGSQLDRLVQKAQSLLAQVESHGPRA